MSRQHSEEMAIAIRHASEMRDWARSVLMNYDNLRERGLNDSEICRILADEDCNKLEAREV